jgi:hypothetical protein
MIASITTDSVRTYLIATGWSLSAHIEFLAEVWHRNSGEDVEEVVLPLVVAGDFDPRMSELIDQLAAYDAVTKHELERRIRAFAYDQFSFRVQHADVRDGTIPLNDGIDLTRNARELLSAAASAALNKRRSFSGRQPIEVIEFLKNTRLGQTEQGSYIVNIFCEIDEPTGDRPASFDVAVSSALSNALNSLQESVVQFNESRDPIAFERSIIDGVSSNLCDALLNMFGDQSQRAVSISFKSGKGRRIFQPESYNYDFSPSDANSIKLASDYFKQIYTLQDVEVAGYIKRLDQELGESSGQVWIHTILPNQQEKNIQVQLPGEQYIQAIHAHEAKQLVRCVGNVVVSPRTARLIDMSEFRVIGLSLQLNT